MESKIFKNSGDLWRYKCPREVFSFPASGPGLKIKIKIVDQVWDGTEITRKPQQWKVWQAHMMRPNLYRAACAAFMGHMGETSLTKILMLLRMRRGRGWGGQGRCTASSSDKDTVENLKARIQVNSKNVETPKADTVANNLMLLLMLWPSTLTHVWSCHRPLDDHFSPLFKSNFQLLGHYLSC